MSRETIDCDPVPVVQGEGYHATNRINISVTYDKTRKRVHVSVYPCHVADGLMSTMLMSGKVFHWEDMSRLNRKRLEAVAAEVRSQVAGRNGAAWKTVLWVAEREGLTIQHPVPTTALLDEEIEIVELD